MVRLTAFMLCIILFIPGLLTAHSLKVMMHAPDPDDGVDSTVNYPIAADNFTVDGHYRIDRVRWWGGFVTPGVSQTDFSITLYEDSGQNPGFPGNPIKTLFNGSVTGTPSSPAVYFKAFTWPNDDFLEHRFETNVSPVVLEPHKEYWLEIRDLTGTDTFLWESSKDDGLYARLDLGAGYSNGSIIGMDLAFALFGHATLPSTAPRFSDEKSRRPSTPPGGFSIPEVPYVYSKIQDAIDAASPGDVIDVAPGTYEERIDFLGKNITVRSLKGRDVTVIRGKQEWSVVVFQNGEGNGAVLDGFTITNGSSYLGSGGVRITNGSSPTITNHRIEGNLSIKGGGISCYFGSAPIIAGNIIANNNSATGGGGIICENSPATIVQNAIYGNTLSGGDGSGIACMLGSTARVHNNIVTGNHGGSAIYCANSSPTISSNLVSGNQNAVGNGGGISCEWNAAPQIIDNVIEGNAVTSGNGGGIYCHQGLVPIITNNLIYGNGASGNGGGLYLSETNASVRSNTFTGNSALWGGGFFCLNAYPQITDSIFWDNMATGLGPEIYVQTGLPTITYCDVKGGWPGTGNINADPLFVTGPGGDFYLSQIAAGQGADSSCVDAGSDQAANLGLDAYWTRTDEVPDAGVVDIGFHYGP